MKRLRPLALVVVATLQLSIWPAPDAAAANLSGVVFLQKGSAGKSSREVQTAQVYYVPESPIDLEVSTEPYEVVTVRKEFLPRTLTVPVGSTVRFPNQDVILHNVFSVSGGNRFDLGLYRRGEGKSTTLEHPGVVRVFCNVHHSMVAYVLVVETPFTTTPDFGGQFALQGLPSGPGTLHVWHERTDPYSRQLTLPLGSPVEVELSVSKPRVPRHTNKFGKPYARKRSGRSYR